MHACVRGIVRRRRFQNCVKCGVRLCGCVCVCVNDNVRPPCVDVCGCVCLRGRFERCVSHSVVVCVRFAAVYNS